jgi:hypothetical protein
MMEDCRSYFAKATKLRNDHFLYWWGTRLGEDEAVAGSHHPTTKAYLMVQKLIKTEQNAPKNDNF